MTQSLSNFLGSLVAGGVAFGAAVGEAAAARWVNHHRHGTLDGVQGAVTRITEDGH